MLKIVMTDIRPAKPEDAGLLLQLWLNAVRATHKFLSESDIQALLPLVRDAALPSLEVWVLCDDAGVPIAFMGLDGANLEALFVEPSRLRKGAGLKLVEHARQMKGPLAVSVNEQNPEALRFYLALGFTETGRSPTDSGGRPFPLIHLADSMSTSAGLC